MSAKKPDAPVTYNNAMMTPPRPQGPFDLHQFQPNAYVPTPMQEHMYIAPTPASRMEGLRNICYNSEQTCAYERLTQALQVAKWSRIGSEEELCLNNVAHDLVKKLEHHMNDVEQHVAAVRTALEAAKYFAANFSRQV